MVDAVRSAARRPLKPGIRTSSTRQSGSLARSEFKNASADSKARGLVTRRAEQAADRVANRLVIVHDTYDCKLCFLCHRLPRYATGLRIHTRKH